MDLQTLYKEVYQEPVWHKWVDALAILFVGIACGIVFMQGMKFYEVKTTTPNLNEIQQELPVSPDNKQNGSVAAPQKSLRFEEV